MSYFRFPGPVTFGFFSSPSVQFYFPNHSILLHLQHISFPLLSLILPFPVSPILPVPYISSPSFPFSFISSPSLPSPVSLVPVSPILPVPYFLLLLFLFLSFLLLHFLLQSLLFLSLQFFLFLSFLLCFPL